VKRLTTTISTVGGHAAATTISTIRRHAAATTVPAIRRHAAASTISTIGRHTIIDIVQELAEAVVHGVGPLSWLICLILPTPRLQNRLQNYRLIAKKKRKYLRLGTSFWLWKHFSPETGF
jgi:hypothetical protein